jgi:hypothetical protein
VRVVAAVIKPRRGRPRAPRLASRGGMGGCGLGLDRPPPPRHSATLSAWRGGVRRDGSLPAWLALLRLPLPLRVRVQPTAAAAPAPPHAPARRTCLSPRLVVSSPMRCGATPTTSSRRSLARSLARVLPNRKASRKNNRQSPKEIGREREKRRRDARGGEEEKAEGEKKKKKNPRPPPARPLRRRALHTRTDGRTSPPSAAGFSQ